VSTGSGAISPDQENGLSSEAHDFITRAVGKAVEGLAARLDALSEQLAAIRQAQVRGAAKPDAGHRAREGGVRERDHP
jgi:hypothetical protein